MKRTAVKAAGFVAGLCILLFCMSRVLTFKDHDGIYSVTNFYELKDNTVDVLVLGSSHAYTDINTGILWREHGIASYVLAASSQSVWNSYYYLKEALKTQSPRLVVLEGFSLSADGDFPEDSIAIKNTYGLKWSKNRVEAIKASVPEERQVEFLLGYTQYHSRYSYLTGEDFGLVPEGQQDWKGTYLLTRMQPCEALEMDECAGYVPLSEKTEKYYRAILALAQEKQIPVLVIVNPCVNINEYDQEKYNTAQRIAEEYQVPFVNYTRMTDELQIDFAVDMADKSHLNYKGSYKLSAELGNYIAEHYDIPDRREDPAYAGWERDAKYQYAVMEDAQLLEMDDAVRIAPYLSRDNYDIFISIDEPYITGEREVNAILNELGIEDADYGGMWYVAGGSEVVWSSGSGEALQYFETDRHDYELKRAKNEEGEFVSRIVIDNQEYATAKNGMNVVVFDTVTGTVADAFGMNADSYYQLCR